MAKDELYLTSVVSYMYVLLLYICIYSALMQDVKPIPTQQLLFNDISTWRWKP